MRKKKRKKEYKGRIGEKPGAKNKQAPGEASSSEKQAREGSEEEPAQRTVRKAAGNRGAPGHQENEKESKKEKIPARTKRTERRRRKNCHYIVDTFFFLLYIIKFVTYVQKEGLKI